MTTRTPSDEAKPAAGKPPRARARSRVTSPAGESPAPIAAKETIVEEQIKTAADQAQQQAGAMFADAGAKAQNAMERGTRMFAELGDFNKGNVEALVESGRIAARGFEAFGQEATAYLKRSYETQLAAFRTLSTAKSPTEFVKVQADLVRQGFDAMVAETSRNTEATLKLAGEIAQPIQNRLALAAEKVRAVA